MKFSLNFVKEFFDCGKTPAEIAGLLTMAGLEIESFEKVGNDYIFDAEVTSNRYDWLSIFGIAGELAAVCKKRLNLKLPGIDKRILLKKPSINIEDNNDCPVYIAQLIRAIVIKDSPPWIKDKIFNCGISAVNNAVDITNYCMLKWGNPLHAFDFDKIEGDIYIRRAKEKEVFLGLDDKERILSPVNLVISDSRKIIALAGVMGAKNAEVDNNTKNIFLESAVFSPLTTRRSRRSAGLDTDSSYRFERNVSARLLEAAAHDAAAYLVKLCGGKLSGYKKAAKSHVSLKAKKISFSFAGLNDYIGEKFSRSEVKSILKNLGFTIDKALKDNIVVKAPFFRLDITGPVDVFEEIVRIYGYDRVKESLPPLTFKKTEDEAYAFKKQLKNFLVSLGLSEIVTYSVTSEENITSLKSGSYIKLTNPLRAQENCLRTTLLPGMLDALCYNINHKNINLRFFEIANIYEKSKNGFIEETCLSCAITGVLGDFFYLKAWVKKILGFLDIEDYLFIDKNRDNFFNSLDIVCRGKIIGFLGILDNRVKQERGLKQDVSFLQISLKTMRLLREKKRYVPFSRYPAVYRDVSLCLEESVKFQQIRVILEKIIGGYLSDYRIIDIYDSKQASGGASMFTLRVFYHSREKTLTTEEVDATHSRLRQHFADEPGVSLR